MQPEVALETLLLTSSYLLAETVLEVEKGWADGPYHPDSLERGAAISKRFPLTQGEKTRMIDDFSISGVTDSCEIHSKFDLHMIDTFCALTTSTPAIP